MDIMEYKNFKANTCYDEMTKKQIKEIDKFETDYWVPIIKELLNTIPEYKMAAYIYDLWEEYEIEDDVIIADAAGITDEGWEKGVDYYWDKMEEQNPLMKFVL